MLREKSKKYNDEHKEYINGQITCNICGCKISRHGLARHQKTKKCNSSIKPIENNHMKMD